MYRYVISIIDPDGRTITLTEGQARSMVEAQAAFKYQRDGTVPEYKLTLYLLTAIASAHGTMVE